MGFTEDFTREQKQEEAYRLILTSYFQKQIIERGKDGKWDFVLSDCTTVEIKTDYRCKDTGNIPFELRGNFGQPSGITSSLADYFLYIVQEPELSTYLIFVFDRETIKHLDTLPHTSKRSNEGALILLIPKEELTNYMMGILVIGETGTIEVLSLSPKEQITF